MGCRPTKLRTVEEEVGRDGYVSIKRRVQDEEIGTKILLEQTICNPVSNAMSVLLIFPRPDKQTRALIEAAQKLNYHCILAVVDFSVILSGTTESHWTRDLKLIEPIDLVIVDRRRLLTATRRTLHRLDTLPRFTSAADIIRKSFREYSLLNDSVFAALLPARSSTKRQTLMASTYEAGFNKCVFELGGVEDAERELRAFAYNELRLLRQCRRRRSGIWCTGSFTHRPNFTLRLERSPSENEAIRYGSETDLNPPKVNPSAEGEDEAQPVISEELANTVVDSITAFQDQEKKLRAYTSLQRTRGKAKSIPCSSSTINFDEQFLASLIAGKDRKNLVRFHNLNMKSPLVKVIQLLFTAKIRSPHTVAKDLQKAIDIICNSDVFLNQVFKPSTSMHDPLTTDLMEGLMVDMGNLKPKATFHRSSSIIGTLKLPQKIVVAPKRLLNSTEIENGMTGDDRWDFNVLNLERITEKRPLRYLAMKIFSRFNVFGVLRMPEDVVAAWVEVMEEHYHPDNPYHNATHAADVVQSCAYFLRKDPIAAVFDSLDEVATLLAAVVHDLNHPGKTNPFLVNSDHPLAILYNDTAVLESHHIALAFDLSRKNPKINIFKNLETAEYRSIRAYMIDMVLATEMARHFEILGKFVNNLSKPMLQKFTADQYSVCSGSSLDSESLGQSSSSNVHTTASAQPNGEASITLERLSAPENRTMLKKMIMKCSDVNNQARPPPMCAEWAKRIATEYFNQTDDEKLNKMPIMMPNFDRQTCNIPKSQLSFIDFFLRDMFSAFDSVCPIPELIKNLDANREYWKHQSEVDENKMEKPVQSQFTAQSEPVAT
ncbi:unnamed protein product [Calicophoron daubneyi]|uniref:Phosphodiesterase n=1 Tax=Calicophoron daubneyi TaxID=300641 RepID=A0AAV2U0W2_CALDB